ncbi:leucine-rich repeat domain-containing protein [Butyrivibrio sp. MB2005]|uniref:leucine-rich repeat domain-containing protein n=1 Tax=Butyrivibrio sp. MB2005 TaxID=1280678 RepID=UPI00047BAA50|nr:leucine-rich repeat domain-containing protein [Butyrivibrio sp. MB2005]
MSGLKKFSLMFLLSFFMLFATVSVITHAAEGDKLKVDFVNKVVTLPLLKPQEGMRINDLIAGNTELGRSIVVNYKENGLEGMCTVYLDLSVGKDTEYFYGEDGNKIDTLQAGQTYTGRIQIMAQTRKLDEWGYPVGDSEIWDHCTLKFCDQDNRFLVFDAKEIYENENYQIFFYFTFTVPDNTGSPMCEGAYTMDLSEENYTFISSDHFAPIEGERVVNTLNNVDKIRFDKETTDIKNSLPIKVDLNNDGKYDVGITKKSIGLEFKKLDTCSCKGSVELKINSHAAKDYDNKGMQYFNPLTFVLSVEKPEEKPADEPVETPNKQEEQKKVEEPVAETEVTINNATYKIDGENATVTAATTAAGNFSVPANVTIGGKSYAVTKIANNAFKGSAIKSITIGSRITEIGDNAFSGCKSLTKATIGKNVTKIGKKAFYNCSKLKKVTFKGNKVKKVGSKAFKKIKKGASFKVPKKVLSSYTRLLKGKRDSGSKIN